MSALLRVSISTELGLEVVIENIPQRERECWVVRWYVLLDEFHFLDI